MRKEKRQQAMSHAVADATSGVTRMQVVDTVYDAQYWRDYRAGLAAWRQAEQQENLAVGYRPDPAPGAAGGMPHPDAAQAARGWHTIAASCGASESRMYVRSEPAARGTGVEQPFALRLLDGLQAVGEWVPRPTVLQDYQRSRLGEVEREWAGDPPAGFGLDADGPEAG